MSLAVRSRFGQRTTHASFNSTALAQSLAQATGTQAPTCDLITELWAQARDGAAQEPVCEPSGGGAQRATRHPWHCVPAFGIRGRAKVSGGMGGHSWSTLSFSSAGTRGTTGTRRRNSVMPWMRIHIAPINGAIGATS